MKRLILFLLLFLILIGPVTIAGQSARRPQTLTAFFVPTDLASIKLWLKASSIVGLNDGDAVATWPDSSGNAFDATQSTSGNKPLYKVNIINHKPIVRFDGTDDFMAGSISGIGTDEAVTVFVVATMATSLSQAYFTVSDNSTANRGPSLFRENLVMRYRVTSGNAAEYNFSTAGFHIHMGLNASTTDRRISKNGIQQDTDTVSASYFAPTSYRIGRLFQDVFPLNGDIAEIVVCDSALSSADQAKVLSYLNAQYSVY